MRKLHFDAALTAEGWRDDVVIAVDAAGTIAAVGAATAADADAERVHGAALPGLPNVHSHAFQRGMAGLTEHAGATDDSFWTWRELMYRFLARMTPEDVEAITALAYAEMLEGGFTVVGEFHYLHHDPAGRPYADLAEMAGRIAAAALETGIGLTLLPVFYAYGNFGGKPSVEGQRRFLTDLGLYARLLEATRRTAACVPDIRFGIAPHSLRAVRLFELKAIVEAAPTGPVHLHISEQTKEVEDCLAAHGKRPAELLFAHMPIDQRWCFIHATHLSDSEYGKMTRRGVVAGLCPVTEANLGDGIFPAANYRMAGGAFGIGTDSNVRISAAAELRALEYSQRLALRRRNALAPRRASTARALFDTALAGGAQALGLQAAGLVPGARADFVVLDTDHLAFASRSGDRLLDSWLFAAADGAVREVYALGRRVVEAGRHIHRSAIEARYRAAIARLMSA